MIHPARRIPYRDLVGGLREAQTAKLVYERRLGGQRQPSRGPDPQRWDVERQRARNLDEQRQST